MLSVASVRSAKGAAGYFAADNYYTAGSPEAAGEWFGKGAERLGLSGPVDQGSFEAVLAGTLPNGVQLGSIERHRAGVDLTFSLPKSWSLIALVGGDRRIVEAYRDAVKDTLRWAEKNAAATRRIENGLDTVVISDNLVAALFEHDNSRAQDPQVHLHAVVANATQGPDGKWRVLHNDKLWSLNTLLNGIAMAGFRERVEAYEHAMHAVCLRLLPAHLVQLVLVRTLRRLCLAAELLQLSVKPLRLCFSRIRSRGSCPLFTPL